MELVGGPFVLLADLVELPHVLEEVGASLEGDEKLGLLAVAPVVRSLNCDGLGSDFLECGVVVPIQKMNKVSQICISGVQPHVTIIDTTSSRAQGGRAEINLKAPTLRLKEKAEFQSVTTGSKYRRKIDWSQAGVSAVARVDDVSGRRLT